MTTRTKSLPFTFGRVGIPIGAVLHFRYNDVFLYRKGEVVKVAGKDLQVTCNGKEYALGKLTRKLLLKRDPSANTNLQPIQRWSYNERRLDSIYEEWKWKKRLGRE